MFSLYNMYFYCKASRELRQTEKQGSADGSVYQDNRSWGKSEKEMANIFVGSRRACDMPRMLTFFRSVWHSDGVA